MDTPRAGWMPESDPVPWMVLAREVPTCPRCGALLPEPGTVCYAELIEEARR